MIDQDQELENLYHGILKHLNKVSNHPIMRGIPQLQENLRGAAELLIEFRKLTIDVLHKEKDNGS